MTTHLECPTLSLMAGQKPYKPNDPPPQPPFMLARGKPMANEPNPPHQPHQTQTHEQLRQSARATTGPTGSTPVPTGQGNLQNILAYFKSQGVADDHVVATIAGFPLRLNELQQPQQPQPHQSLGQSGQAPGHNKSEPKHEPKHEPKAEERKRPSKTEENDA